MSARLHVTVDPDAVSPSKAIAAAARSAPLLVLTHRAFSDLAAELGGDDEAVRHISRVATNTGRPIGTNLLTGPKTSSTLFIPPKGWTSERLTGWVAGHHAELEDAFGAASIRRPA